MEASDTAAEMPADPTHAIDYYKRDDYEPHFDRMGTHRRVLGHVTDLDHVGRGPRNTAARLQQELEEDPYTNINEGDDVQEYLDDLEAAGLLSKEDDRYVVTEAGHIELGN